MDNQTYDYIALKPIADRFKNIANTISDDDIKELILSELKKQIREQVNFGSAIQECVDTWLEDYKNTDFVIECLRSSIEEKFKDRRY